VLESNHDLEMLKVGPYPWWVKQRVMGRHGHLSNDMASDFIRQDMAASTAALILAHLSAHNNHPELARLVGTQALNQRGLSTRLIVAEHGQQTEVIEL
jgi:phosphoribosyl 1,2-cyclic phosphodiesterase